MLHVSLTTEMERCVELPATMTVDSLNSTRLERKRCCSAGRAVVAAGARPARARTDIIRTQVVYPTISLRRAEARRSGDTMRSVCWSCAAATTALLLTSTLTSGSASTASSLKWRELPAEEKTRYLLTKHTGTAAADLRTDATV